MRYQITTINGANISNNVHDYCLDCILICKERCKKIKCTHDRKERRIGKIVSGNFIIFLCDEKHIKSTKLFKKEIGLLKDFSINLESLQRSVFEDVNNQTYRLLHNLVTYNAHILQDIYSIISQDDLQKKRKEIVKTVNALLTSGSRNNALHILSILKNANLMKSEFSIFTKLYEPNPTMSIINHKIHKVVLLVFNSFWYDLMQNKNYIKIQSCNEAIPIDYESVTAALVHVIDNTTKYIMPNTDLNVNFKNSDSGLILSFDMISLQIKQCEINKVFEEGYSGEVPVEHDLSGRGVGLYMVKRLLV